MRKVGFFFYTVSCLTPPPVCQPHHCTYLVTVQLLSLHQPLGFIVIRTFITVWWVDPGSLLCTWGRKRRACASGLCDSQTRLNIRGKKNYRNKTTAVNVKRSHPHLSGHFHPYTCSWWLRGWSPPRPLPRRHSDRAPGSCCSGLSDAASPLSSSAGTPCGWRLAAAPPLSAKTDPSGEFIQNSFQGI